MIRKHKFSVNDLVVVDVRRVRDAIHNKHTGAFAAPGYNSHTYQFKEITFSQAIIISHFGRLIQTLQDDPYVHEGWNRKTRWTYISDYIIILAGDQAGRLCAITEDAIMSLEDYDTYAMTKKDAW